MSVSLMLKSGFALGVGVGVGVTQAPPEQKVGAEHVCFNWFESELVQ